MFESKQKYPDRCTSILLGKNYKPTWSQNHPSAEFRRMFLCPALEKALFCLMNMLPNWLTFLSLNSTSYKWRLPIDAQYENPGGS